MQSFWYSKWQTWQSHSHCQNVPNDLGFVVLKAAQNIQGVQKETQPIGECVFMHGLFLSERPALSL